MNEKYLRQGKYCSDSSENLNTDKVVYKLVSTTSCSEEKLAFTAEPVRGDSLFLTCSMYVWIYSKQVTIAHVNTSFKFLSVLISCAHVKILP